MATTVDFDDVVQAKFDKAFDRRAQQSLGAAPRFAFEVDEAIDLIAEDPEQFPGTSAGRQSCTLH